MYLQFCYGLGTMQVSIPSANLGRFIQFRPQDYASPRLGMQYMYLNAARLMHREAGHPGC